MIAFYVIFAVLVLVLYILTLARDSAAVESFLDMKMPMDMSAVSEAAKKLADAPAMSLEGIPTPPELFKKARELMAKYDQPDLWIHAARVMDKDPGQLARMNLGIE
jgi:hypothetical protein